MFCNQFKLNSGIIFIVFVLCESVTISDTTASSRDTETTDSLSTQILLQPNIETQIITKNIFKQNDTILERQIVILEYIINP